MSDDQKAYMSSGEVFKTITDYLSSGHIEEAANLYSRCQEDIGYQLISRCSADLKLKQSLAKMFFAARDYQKAGAVCEEMDEFQKAAQLYERCDDYYLAAEMYARVDDHTKAAEMFERYGDYNKAAELYTQVKKYDKAAQNFEKAINNFLAGKYYFHLKKFQKSMELLQKVAHDDNTYLEASILIGNILAKHGYLDLALRKYQSVIKDMPLDRESMSLYYNLGILYAKKNMWAEAKQVFQDIMNFDFNYKDVAKKIKEIDKRVAQGDSAPQPADAVDEIIDLEEKGDEKEAQVVSVMDGFEFLKSTSIFKNLSLAEMKAFYNVSDMKTYQPGEIIIEQAVPGKALFIIKKGSVWVQRVDGETVMNIIELPEGAHVGEMSLVEDQLTSARIAAGAEGAEAFEITRTKFTDLLNASDKTALKILRVFIGTLSQRLRDTTQELAEARK